MKLAPNGNSECSTAELAAFIGVSMQTINEWAKSWLASAKVKYGVFAVRQAVDLWVKNIVAPPVPEGQETEADARRRKEIARANKEELRAKREAESLVPKEQAENWLIQLLSEAKTAFLGSGRRLAPEIYGKEIRDIEAVINTENKRILRKMARPVADKTEEKHAANKSPRASSKRTEPTGRPDRQPVGRKKPRPDRTNKRRARPVAK